MINVHYSHPRQISAVYRSADQSICASLTENFPPHIFDHQRMIRLCTSPNARSNQPLSPNQFLRTSSTRGFHYSSAHTYIYSYTYTFTRIRAATIYISRLYPLETTSLQASERDASTCAVHVRVYLDCGARAHTYIRERCEFAPHTHTHIYSRSTLQRATLGSAWRYNRGVGLEIHIPISTLRRRRGTATTTYIYILVRASVYTICLTIYTYRLCDAAVSLR